MGLRHNKTYKDPSTIFLKKGKTGSSWEIDESGLEDQFWKILVRDVNKQKIKK